ncbi:MAG: D-alanyl-D-alanine carboxypeptidase [Clostridia bacterium]|nr:D-alanyl-D-alanine carboxypeptidase [Clostridia bacterium]
MMFKKIISIILVVAAAMLVSCNSKHNQPVQKNETVAVKDTEIKCKPVETSEPDKEAETVPEGEERNTIIAEELFSSEPPVYIESTSMLMINADTGEHIYEKDAHKELAPASMTKVMTTIVALECIEDMNSEFTFTDEHISYLRSLSSSVAGFSAGETVSAKDLIYATMLPSGGDGAIGVAILAAGSVESFVDLMNKKVEELGLEHTHFANPTGLDELNHYSSAYDMCQIMNYAVKNEAFIEIITTRDYTTAPTPYHPNGIKLRNLIQEGVTNNSISAPYLIGGKPGFTDAAKLCLVTYAEHNDTHYILATLGAGNGEKYPQYHFTDMDAIYTAYFSQENN